MPTDSSQQRQTMAQLERARTSVLDIAYEHAGPPAGYPVVLMHGFPYDPRAFDEVVAVLDAAGFRTIVPYLRGYGGTRFHSADTMRSGQQAALGHDMLDLLGELDVRDAVLAGFDCRGRAPAGTGARARDLLRLSDPEHRGGGAAGGSRKRASLVVPVLLPHRARAGRTGSRPQRDLPVSVAALVADLAVRRRDVPAHRRVVRECRLRRRRHPFLSAPARQCRRRSALCGDRG